MSCSFCIILILQKYESSHSSHLIGSFSCSNGMIFECHLPEVISDLLIMLCFYIMKNWITSLFWESCQHPHPHSAHSAQIRWHSYPALLHWQEKESSYLSPNYSFQAAWAWLEPAKRPLAGPSSLKRIIGADIRALFLWSVK